jgi:hypothetical protein
VSGTNIVYDEHFDGNVVWLDQPWALKSFRHHVLYKMYRGASE